MAALDGLFVNTAAYVSEMRRYRIEAYLIPNAGLVEPNATPPVVSNIQPPNFVLASRSQPIEFDVTDVSPGIAGVVVTVKYQYTTETHVIWNGTEFLDPYVTISSITTIDGGFHFEILPTGGWRQDIEKLKVYAVDSDGNAL